MCRGNDVQNLYQPSPPGLGVTIPRGKEFQHGSDGVIPLYMTRNENILLKLSSGSLGGVWEGSHGRARRRQHISCHDRVKGTWRDLIALGLPEISVYHKPAENFQKNRPEKCIHGKVIHFFLKGRMSLSLSKPKWFLWFMKKKKPSSKQIAKLPFGVNCVLVQGFLIRIKGLSVLCHMQFFCKRVVE